MFSGKAGAYLSVGYNVCMEQHILTLLPNAVAFTSITVFLHKSCSDLLPNMLVKFTTGCNCLTGRNTLAYSSGFSVMEKKAGNTKGGSITEKLTSCLTGPDKSVSQMKTKIVNCHTADSKPVKQEVNGTMILPPPLVFRDKSFIHWHQQGPDGLAGSVPVGNLDGLVHVL
jgi:hypothetical protein